MLRDHTVPVTPFQPYCEFPTEIVCPQRSLAARTFTDILRWSVMPRGGHFGAMEQLQALAEEVAPSIGRFGLDSLRDSLVPRPGSVRLDGQHRARHRQQDVPRDAAQDQLAHG